ncbi:hypothetical protein [Glutamicibacter sp. X7]
MKHQQILDKLALGVIPSLIQDETHMLARQSFYEAKHAGHRGARHSEVVPPLLRRWGPLMERHGDRCELMTGHRVAIALATCLHKVGLADPSLTERALRGIDELNDAVWLSDEFARQSPAYSDLLRSTPPALGKTPAVREPVTFTRPGDLLASTPLVAMCWPTCTAILAQTKRPYLSCIGRFTRSYPRLIR